jgi:hypothetical protein
MCVGGGRSVCPGGLCWFIPGVAEWYHVMLGSHLFGLSKVSQALLEPVVVGAVAWGWQPTCSFSVWWCGEAFQGLGVWVPEFQLSLVLHSQVWLQHRSKVPNSRSSCCLCLCPLRHFGSPNPPFSLHITMTSISSSKLNKIVQVGIPDWIRTSNICLDFKSVFLLNTFPLTIGIVQ